MIIITSVRAQRSKEEPHIMHMPCALLTLALVGASSALKLSAELPPDVLVNVQGPQFAEQGMQAWSADDLSLVNFREHQLGGEYLDVGAVTEPGSKITVEASEDKPAMLYAFVYGCYPCPATQDGLLHEMINEDNWRLGYCAPRFRSELQDRTYRLIAFAKDVPAGGNYTLTIPGFTHYAGFLATETFANCAEATGTNKETCEATGRLPDERCAWDKETETCEFVYCHGNIGPSRDRCDTQNDCAPSAGIYV